MLSIDGYCFDRTNFDHIRHYSVAHCFCSVNKSVDQLKHHTKANEREKGERHSLCNLVKEKEEENEATRNGNTQIAEHVEMAKKKIQFV